MKKNLKTVNPKKTKIKNKNWKKLIIIKQITYNVLHNV